MQVYTGRASIYIIYKVMGMGEGSAGGGQDELFVNSLFGLTVTVIFFIHWVLVSWYFKNRCVNHVFIHIQLQQINPRGRQLLKIWEF